jgi:iron complex outermembrane receptor protein
MAGDPRATIIVAGRAARWTFALWLALASGASASAAAADSKGDDDDSAEDDESDEDLPDEPPSEDAPANAGGKKPSPERAVAARVRVRGEREAQALQAFRHPASLVARDLDDSVPPGATLADVLAQLPGLQLRRLGGPGDPSYAAIRGSSSQQVEVWVDGVPLNPLGSGAIDLSELALEAFDRVEVWRGLAPAELGGSPIGGVIHLTSKPGTALPTEIQAGIGTWATRHASARAGTAQQLPGGGLADARLSLALHGTEGNYPYFDDGGTQVNQDDDQWPERANNAYDQLNLAAQLRLGHGPVLLRLSDRLHWHSGGEPGPGHGTTASARSRGSSNLASVALRAAAHPRLRASADISYLHRTQRFTDSLGEIVVGATDREDRSDLLTASAILRWQALPWLQVHPTLRATLEATERFEHLVPTLGAGTRMRGSAQLAVAATASLLSERLTILGVLDGFALDNRALGALPFSQLAATADGEERAFQVLPRLAVALHPASWLTLRAGVARGFRPPTFTELFGDRAGILGNPALLPERADTLDVSLRLAGQPHPMFAAAAEVGGFFVSTVDAIVLRHNSQRLVVPINFGRTRTAGIEASASIDAFERLQLSAALTWIDARIIEAEAAYIDNRVPLVPEWDLDLRVLLEPLPWMTLGWTFSYTAGSYDSRTNLFEQAPRPLHTLSMRVEPGPGFPWFAVELRNVSGATTWRRDRDPLQPDPDDQVQVRIEDFRGNPLPGRAVMLSVGWLPGEAR